MVQLVDGDFCSCSLCQWTTEEHQNTATSRKKSTTSAHLLFPRCTFFPSSSLFYLCVSYELLIRRENQCEWKKIIILSLFSRIDKGPKLIIIRYRSLSFNGRLLKMVKNYFFIKYFIKYYISLRSNIKLHSQHNERWSLFDYSRLYSSTLDYQLGHQRDRISKSLPILIFVHVVL